MPVRLNQHLQDTIIRLLAADGDFCRLVRGRLEPEFFGTRMTGDVGGMLLDYAAQHGEAAGEHFGDELARMLESVPEDAREDYVRYAAKLADMPPPNRAYVLRRVNAAVRLRAREDAALQFAELVSAGKIDEADNVMYAALRSGLPSEEGCLDYLRDLSSLARRGDRPDYLMRTGIRALDRLFGGFRRGELVCVMGGAGGGKTWGLMWIARQAMRQGLRVLHITHEVGQDQMELRYDMMFSGRGTKAGMSLSLPRNRDGRLAWRDVEVQSVFDDAAVKRARRAARSRGGRLLIKKYPMGQCTTAEIERLLSSLEDQEGFVPDVVVNDYPAIMDLSRYSDQTRHQIHAAYVWSKGLADERQILVVTAHQLNREGLDRRIIYRRHVSEDIRVLANVDCLLAIGRTREDVDHHLAGIGVLKSRADVQDVGCTFVPAFAIGQFAVDSWLMGDIQDDSIFQYEEKD